MKRKILCLLLLSVGFVACDKNLDVAPTLPVADSYYADETHIQRGVGGVYAKLTDLYGYNANAPRHRVWLLPGDDIRANNPSALDNFTGLTASNGDLANVWKALYEIVSRSNEMLAAIDANPKAYTTAGLQANNKGEMLFLRSWAFYKLWMGWGKAPLETAAVQGYTDSLYHHPSRGLQMLDTAIAGLAQAATLLPDAWPANETGRITKDGALGMLVKCYVTRACFNGKNAADYQAALQAFAKLSASRQLVPFGNNFDYRQENNAESLFEFQASASSTENPFLDNDFGNGVGEMGAFYQFFDDTWTNLGTLMAPTPKLVAAFEAGDPRIQETFQPNNSSAWTFNGGYKMVKYVNGDRNKYTGIATVSSINNTRLLRLADVKLLAAEAYLATSNTAAALKEVNDVRTRARGTGAVPANFTTITLQNIMDERFRELAGEEGIRWDDLRRWNAGGYINLANWKLTDFGFATGYSPFGFDAKTHVLWPIPTTEMDTNPNMLADGQNNGY